MLPSGPFISSASCVYFLHPDGVTGRVIADVSALQLKDGRWRLLLNIGGEYRSAISSDGLSLTMESGTRIANGACTHARALRLDDRRIRVYCSSLSSGIFSYIGTDEGTTLTLESGVRHSQFRIEYFFGHRRHRPNPEWTVADVLQRFRTNGRHASVSVFLFKVLLQL